MTLEEKLAFASQDIEADLRDGREVEQAIAEAMAEYGLDRSAILRSLGGVDGLVELQNYELMKERVRGFVQAWHDGKLKLIKFSDWVEKRFEYRLASDEAAYAEELLAQSRAQAIKRHGF